MIFDSRTLLLEESETSGTPILNFLLTFCLLIFSLYMIILCGKWVVRSCSLSCSRVTSCELGEEVR